MHDERRTRKLGPTDAAAASKPKPVAPAAFTKPTAAEPTTAEPVSKPAAEPAAAEPAAGADVQRVHERDGPQP